MRRMIRERLRDERGGVAVIVAVAMVALLGFTAVAVDTGALLAERSQLQNGADAAAIAIAQQCAAGNCGATATTAQTLANANANDLAANIGTPTFPTATSVNVTTTTRDGDTGAGSLAFVFAPFIGIDTQTVLAEATAAWGSPAAGPATLGLAFAPCAFQLDGAIQVISKHGDSGGTNCESTSPSGQSLPGGFGWLHDPDQDCQVDVAAGTNATQTGNAGVSIPDQCLAVLNSVKDTTVLLPVYEDKGGSGSTAYFTIRGWAAFKVLGWRFPGTSYNNTVYTGARCTSPCRGLIGQFITFVSLDNRFTSGGPSLGSSVVRLTK